MSMYLCLDQGLRGMTLLRQNNFFFLYLRVRLAQFSHIPVKQAEQVYRPAEASNPQCTENHDE